MFLSFPNCLFKQLYNWNGLGRMVQQLVPPLFLHRLNVQWMGLSQNVTPTKHIEGTCRTMKRITVPFIYRFAGVIWLVNCGGGCCWLTVIETRNMTSALCLSVFILRRPVDCVGGTIVSAYQELYFLSPFFIYPLTSTVL